MKTGVEWLVDEHFGGIENCTPDFRFHIQQALEMEKEKIINALIEFSKAHFDIHTEEAILNITRRAEKYYNETFKKQETETYPCPQCQGGGCPYCCGYGTIPK